MISKKEIKEVLENKTKDKKIVFAPQKEAKELSFYVDKILKFMKIKSAWISDESCFGDFMLSEKKLTEISEKIGISVLSKDYLVKIAKQMKEEDENESKNP